MTKYGAFEFTLPDGAVEEEDDAPQIEVAPPEIAAAVLDAVRKQLSTAVRQMNAAYKRVRMLQEMAAVATGRTATIARRYANGLGMQLGTLEMLTEFAAYMIRGDANVVEVYDGMYDMSGEQIVALTEMCNWHERAIVCLAILRNAEALLWFMVHGFYDNGDGSDQKYVQDSRP